MSIFSGSAGFHLEKVTGATKSNGPDTNNSLPQIAGLKDAHFHDTRHNAATELLNAGTPERALCQIAGWKSGNMLRTYYHRNGPLAARSVVWLAAGQE